MLSFIKTEKLGWGRKGYQLQNLNVLLKFFFFFFLVLNLEAILKFGSRNSGRQVFVLKVMLSPCQAMTQLEDI